MTDVLANSNDTIEDTRSDNVYNQILKKSASFFSKPSFLSSLPPANELKPWQHPIGNVSPEEIIAHRVKHLKDLDGEDPFYVADLGEIARQQMAFKTLLPRVEPFYGELFLGNQSFDFHLENLSLTLMTLTHSRQM
jgi:hypothetical protein